MAKSWFTSDDIIESAKRKISFPISQVTFTDDDILKFANEEMMISQVPSVLSFHEEYYVAHLSVELEADKSRYPIPDRAIGMRLRDIFWEDTSGNLYEMTRVSPEDKAFYQRSTGANSSIYKYYIEGNDIVLTPTIIGAPSGSLQFSFFIRPNQLVANDRAAISTAFCSKLTVVNASIIAGDTVSIGGQTFTAVAGAPAANQFQIGGTSVITATNLVSAINTNGIAEASNGSPSTAIVTAHFSNSSYIFSTSNTAGFSISSRKCIKFDSIPDHIIDGTVVDFLQTRGGHRIYSYSVTIPTGGVSTDSIEFEAEDFPEDFIVGDYICEEFECIIPFLPDDLHNGLAERTSARILAAIGDKEGLAVSNQKIQEIEIRQGSLLDNRVEGAPQKITNKHSLLRYNTIRRR